jgi:hypothetical protein
MGAKISEVELKVAVWGSSEYGGFSSMKKLTNKKNSK